MFYDCSVTIKKLITRFITILFVYIHNLLAQQTATVLVRHSTFLQCAIALLMTMRLRSSSKYTNYIIY